MNLPKQTLRPYQSAAIDSLRAHIRAGKRRLLLIAPTGSGKTTCASHMIEGAVKRGLHVLFVAHRDLLIEQASARLDEHDIDHGIVMAQHHRNRPDAPVQVASIQTLARRKEWPQAQLVIIDEAHHAVARSYRMLFERYANAHFVGLTATPWRSDGRGLDGLFEDSVIAASPGELIRLGSLVDYFGFTFNCPDLSGIKTVAGEYEQAQLAERVSQSAILGDVVGQWAAHASSLKTVCFCVNIDHAQKMAERFKESGYDAEVIHHELSNSDRSMCVDRVRSGSTRVICNVGILGEGVDIPDLECCILARPTKSLALYLQQVGRVMRPAPGKERARIHDHAGCVARFGLPDDDRDYSLSATRESNGMGAVSRLIRTCPQCFAIMKSGQAWPCLECGHTPELIKKVIAERAADAIDIRTTATSPAAVRHREMEAFKQELVAMAIRKRLKPGWLVHKFLERYPDAPKPWAAFRAVKARQNA